MLSEKLLRRLMWILIALAIVFCMVAFYVPVKTLLVPATASHATKTIVGEIAVLQEKHYGSVYPID